MEQEVGENFDDDDERGKGGHHRLESGVVPLLEGPDHLLPNPGREKTISIMTDPPVGTMA